MIAAPAQQPTIADVTDDLDARRRLAFDANYELESLAGAAKKLLAEERSDSTVKYTGILSRIETLSSIIFFAMRLHGEPNPVDAWGRRDSLEALKRVFDGGMA